LLDFNFGRTNLLEIKNVKKKLHFGVFKTQNRLSDRKWHPNFENLTQYLTFLPKELFRKIVDTFLFCSIVGIFENSAFFQYRKVEVTVDSKKIRL